MAEFRINSGGPCLLLRQGDGCRRGWMIYVQVLPHVFMNHDDACGHGCQGAVLGGRCVSGNLGFRQRGVGKGISILGAIAGVTGWGAFFVLHRPF